MKLLWTVVSIALATGCVSKSKHEGVVKKLREAEARGDKCESELRGRTLELEARTTELTACQQGKEEEATGRAAAEKQSAELGENIKATAAELAELRKQREEIDKRLAAFKALTEKFQKMIDTGTLKVRVRNGRMLVTLPAGVLFDSGKAELSKKGEKAIAAVATVLKEIPDRSFSVRGHTDADPIKDSTYKDNWELSVARALTVTKFLIGAGMDPKTLSAAGSAEHDPVANNKTKKGKQLNRRIEIVLEPKIEELPSLPETPAEKDDKE